MESVCTVIVNWNGASDTIACLESLLQLEHPRVTVVVCDNGSTDDSTEVIEAWARSRTRSQVRRGRTDTPASRGFSYVRYDRELAEAGGQREGSPWLVLVRIGENLGFAGGNNVGLRYALARGEFDYLWLLNNDTVVVPDTLTHLIEVARGDVTVGIVGSTLLHHQPPHDVQAWGGGSYNAWLALPRHLGARRHADEPPRARDLARMRYIVGASMLVSARFVREVGLLSEEYFLFFEELDWVMRSRRRFRIAYAPRSVVYHKEGASVGGSTSGPKSWTADYYFTRNRVLFTRKFFPRRLATVYLALVVAALRRAWRGEWDRVQMIRRICRHT